LIVVNFYQLEKIAFFGEKSHGYAKFRLIEKIQKWFFLLSSGPYTAATNEDTDDNCAREVTEDLSNLAFINMLQ
jgi:hypothetical protein